MITKIVMDECGGHGVVIIGKRIAPFPSSEVLKQIIENTRENEKVFQALRREARKLEKNGAFNRLLMSEVETRQAERKQRAEKERQVAELMERREQMMLEAATAHVAQAASPAILGDLLFHQVMGFLGDRNAATTPILVELARRDMRIGLVLTDEEGNQLTSIMVYPTSLIAPSSD